MRLRIRGRWPCVPRVEISHFCFASTLLPLYLLSRESTPPIGRRGETLLENCLRYLGRRCQSSFGRRSPRLRFHLTDSGDLVRSCRRRDNFLANRSDIHFRTSKLHVVSRNGCNISERRESVRNDQPHRPIVEQSGEVDPGSGCDPSLVDYDRLRRDDIEDKDLIKRESSNQQV